MMDKDSPRRKLKKKENSRIGKCIDITFVFIYLYSQACIVVMALAPANNFEKKANGVYV